MRNMLSEEIWKRQFSRFVLNLLVNFHCFGGLIFCKLWLCIWLIFSNIAIIITITTTTTIIITITTTIVIIITITREEWCRLHCLQRLPSQLKVLWLDTKILRWTIIIITIIIIIIPIIPITIFPINRFSKTSTWKWILAQFMPC